MAPLYALSALLMVAYAAIFTLLAQLRAAFGYSETAIGAIVASAFIAGFFAQLGLARFADTGHGARLMRIGLALTFLGLVWMCFAESLWSWLAARTMLGFGAGCVRPGIRRLAFVVDPKRAGELLGRLAAWEIAGFLVGPIVASVLFEQAGLRAPFAFIALLALPLAPFVWRVQVPGTRRPLKRAMLTLLRRPAMQSCIALGVAFYLAVGVFDAIWALFMADLGASQVFIGATMSLFTLPMLVVAPWAGRLAARRHVLNLISLTMTGAMLAMISYGFIDSIWWICLPVLVHAVMDAVSMPAVQLAVGYASGEEAFAAGQGLFGATGLMVAAAASLTSGAVYQSFGAGGLWLGAAGAMGVAILVARWRGRDARWRDALADQVTV
jgi:MFS family permease